jgi:hypothetical protein
MEFINFFKLKSLNDVDETIEFEEKFKISLPPIYKCFIQTFEINRKCIYYPSYLNKNNGMNTEFTTTIFQKSKKLALN